MEAEVIEVAALFHADLPEGHEELRMHVHIMSGSGEAKYWLEPQIELAKNYHLTRVELREIEQIIEAHLDEIKAAWNAHFGG